MAENGSVVVDASVERGSQDLLIGQLLGGYQITARVGAGGMGTVYLAQHQRIGRKAAVKVLQASAAADAQWRQRFLVEAEALASLKHRNLVDVYEFGDLPDGRQYLMMEFLEGEPLDRYVAQNAPLAPARALTLVEQILNGLGEAHKKGIVHRDLKPANVILLREHSGEVLVKLLDFGLARQDAVPLSELSEVKREQQASLVAGTPEYISPEQAQGKQVDGTADLYSLGVMLYEMLAGELPFQSESVTGLLQMHLAQRAPLLSTKVSNLPEGVEEFVASLLEKDTVARPRNADVARQQVQRLLKRIAAEATTVRPAPIAPTAHAQTEKVLRLPDKPADAPTTDLTLNAPPRRSRAAIGAIAVVLLGAVTWFVTRPGPVVVEPIPEVQRPVAISDAGISAAIALDAGVEIVAPVAVVVDAVDSGLMALDPLPVIKKHPVKNPVLPVVETCTPDAQWKKQAHLDLAELMNRASKITSLLSQAADTEERLSREINIASAPADCGAVNRALTDFQRAIRKAEGK